MKNQTTNVSFQVSDRKISKACTMMRIMSRKTAWKVLCYVSKNPNKTVEPIAEGIGLPYANTVQAMSWLRRYNLILCIKDGKYTKVQINQQKVKRIIRALEGFNFGGI